MADDEEEGGFGGLYENGHWVWDDTANGLVFVRSCSTTCKDLSRSEKMTLKLPTYDIFSDLPPKPLEAVQITTKAPTGTVEFRDDVDLIEQDAKDVAIYTAPVNILSPMLINMLHLPTTERFIRALLLCCAYYLQGGQRDSVGIIFSAGSNMVGSLEQHLLTTKVTSLMFNWTNQNVYNHTIADEMANRIIEMETKVRTPDCEILEFEYRDNLADLRLLVAKEYCTMLIGGGDMRKFHHMGPTKKRRSLSDKDARLFETLLRICVQIVWLALGRKSFNQIELEANRIFKSEIFNAVEHILKTDYVNKMAKEERAVLLGHCVRHDKKMNTRSPLMNEVFCHRQIDYRMMGLGVIKCPHISPRLRFMLLAIAGREEILRENGISLGIIGMPRSAFDTMLRPLPTAAEGKSKASMSSASGYSSKSSGSMRKSQLAAHKLYPDVVLPRKESKEIFFPPSFPDEPEEPKQCSETQRRRWQTRLQKMLHPQPVGH